ncbi:MAG TPA: asparaginase domain-containing protein, partial [Iamia sp.]|nr:asparaginase domain-containing protein [Iamia sp.]
MTPAAGGRTREKICLLYTGGTIGMVRAKRGELRPPERPEDFLKLAPELKDVVDFDFEPVMNKDSTNVNHRDWEVVARKIHELMHSNRGYTGYVVAHGTDTMHFTASAVSFALGNKLPAPIVFTGAQTIPEVHHGDARVNLMRAFEVAVHDIGEVVISFGDYVFRGNRAQKKDEARFDAFESPALFPLAHITEKILIHSLMAPRIPGAAVPLQADFADGVLQISLIPGLTASLVTPAIENP